MRTAFRLIYLLALTGSLLSAPASHAGTPAPGADVAEVFARAQAGAPLRCVALGGSITQAGKGWIGPWLQEHFPDSDVTMINSGMSATGSQLGIFRVERDVIAHQPDLVLIEYCVNDGGLSDEEAVRYMESLIVRLKSLPQPPAIVILEAAAEDGVNLARHRRVAQHYGLLDVDLQAAVDAELAASDKPWKAFYGDRVHPNAKGHAFYAEVIGDALVPYLNRLAKANTPSPTLPKPLSSRPLILDGRMAALTGVVDQPGWSHASPMKGWWSRFFNGSLKAEEPGAELSLTFRGTTVGLLYLLDENNGSFCTLIDGQQPQLRMTNSRNGYTYKVLASDLPAQLHRLSIVLSPETDPGLLLNGPVELGYLLLAGETDASDQLSPQDTFTTADVRGRFALTPVAITNVRWAGPYPVADPAATDALSSLKTPYAPENGEANWQPLPAATGKPGDMTDFRELSGNQAPAVTYVAFEADLPEATDGMLVLRVDYYARLWVNGELAGELDGMHGAVRDPNFLPVKLRAGKNRFLLKTASGSAGHAASFLLYKDRED